MRTTVQLRNQSAMTKLTPAVTVERLMLQSKDYLRQADVCALMASAARWPETREVWQHVEKLYRYVAQQRDRVTLGLLPSRHRDSDRLRPGRVAAATRAVLQPPGDSPDKSDRPR